MAVWQDRPVSDVVSVLLQPKQRGIKIPLANIRYKMSKNWKKKIHPCTWCKKDQRLKDAPAEGSLFVGTYFNEYTQKTTPIRAYLCDMHADECKGYWK